jgi:hypothetical protein
MSDFKLDLLTGDIAFEAGDFVLLDGPEAIAQELRIRLRFFAGEWFADTRIGLPYFQSIFLKSPNINSVQSIFRDVILGTPGVISLQSLSLDLNAARKLTVSFSAIVAGSDVVIDFTEEFILPGTLE